MTRAEQDAELERIARVDLGAAILLAASYALQDTLPGVVPGSTPGEAPTTVPSPLRSVGGLSQEE